MTKITGSFKTFIQGISQQPERERLDGQGWEQVNFRSSALDGLVRRPATVVRHHLPFPLDSTCGCHHYRRGDSEAYRVYVTGGVIRVINDNTGEEIAVSGSYADGYLSTDDAGRDLSFLTIGDVTMIANRQKTVAASATKTAEKPSEALVFVSHGNYGSTFRVLIDGVVKASYTTPDGSTSSHRLSIATQYIAGQLYTNLVTNLGAGWTVTQYAYVIHIVKNDGAPFTISVEDSNGGADMSGFSDAVSEFSDLPPQGPIGYKAKVVGQDNVRSFGQWFEHKGEGLWQECVGPDTSLGLDPSTMPHVLLRLSGGTFLYGAATEGLSGDFPYAFWQPRFVGDDDSNPMPSFVGYPIEDLGAFQNRLLVLADENLIMSRTGGFFDFFRQSATGMADDDPIDIAGSENEVAELRAALGFNKTLLLWSGNAQFAIDGTRAVTPTNVSMPVVSRYEIQTTCKPVAAGASVFFAHPYGNFTGLKEYFVDTNSSDVNRADSVTAHVPRLIPGSARKLAATTNFDVVGVLSNSNRGSLYIYEYLWSGEKKVLSSWSEWTFPEGTFIVDVDIRDSSIYLTVTRNGGSSALLQMDFSVPETDGLGYNAALDFVTVLTTYDEGGAVYFDAPKEDNLRLAYDEELVVLYGTGHPYVGLPVVGVVHEGSGKYRLEGELTAAGFDVVVGLRFKSRYRLTMPRVRDRDGVIIEGTRQQMQTMTFQYADTGAFDVVVTYSSGVERRYQFSGNQIGLAQFHLDKPNMQAGSLRVPIRHRVDGVQVALESDSHTPCKLLHGSWDATFRQRGSRV